jgi:hypothetical protein
MGLTEGIHESHIKAPLVRTRLIVDSFAVLLPPITSGYSSLLVVLGSCVFGGCLVFRESKLRTCFEVQFFAASLFLFFAAG